MENKLNKLQNLLKGLESFAIAFSGGVDSTFLLAMAKKAGPQNLLAVTAESSFVPAREVALAKEMASELGVEHYVINMDLLGNDRIAGNPTDRCYHCKKEIFSKILAFMRARGIDTLVHAVNLDDLGDYRPGLEAARELGVLAPLVDTGFSKADIRAASKAMGLYTWDKPSQSCLATRIPYNTTIISKTLNRIEAAENMLQDMGFAQVRVRVFGDTARIEVVPGQIAELVREVNRKKILPKFKKIGFQTTSVDLGGYRTGKMNPLRLYEKKTNKK